MAPSSAEEESNRSHYFATFLSRFPDGYQKEKPKNRSWPPKHTAASSFVPPTPKICGVLHRLRTTRDIRKPRLTDRLNSLVFVVSLALKAHAAASVFAKILTKRTATPKQQRMNAVHYGTTEKTWRTSRKKPSAKPRKSFGALNQRMKHGVKVCSTPTMHSHKHVLSMNWTKPCKEMQWLLPTILSWQVCTNGSFAQLSSNPRLAEDIYTPLLHGAKQIQAPADRLATNFFGKQVVT